jgi:hypothetical protein
MRIAGESIGPRGITVLAVTGVVGVLIGAHGWSGRHNGLPAGTLGAGSRPTRAGSPSPGASTPSGPSTGHSPAPAAGPKLSSQSYASVSFLVWPGTPSAAATAAKTGLVIDVTRKGSGISVRAGVSGQKLPPARYYPTGARVYVIEASMGDDAGGSDYNIGDDGLVVTDSQGRIVQ